MKKVIQQEGNNLDDVIAKAVYVILSSPEGKLAISKRLDLYSQRTEIKIDTFSFSYGDADGMVKTIKMAIEGDLDITLIKQDDK